MFERFICWLYDVGMYFYTEHRCVKCKHPVSDYIQAYSDGRCPFCGFKHSLACTFIKTEEIAYKTKYVKTGSFFWQYKIVREYKENNF